MIEALVTGKLHGAPEQRLDKTNQPFSVCKVRASLAGDNENVLVNVIAFDADACAALLDMHDGDGISLAGTITPRVWTDKQGNTRPVLDMVAHRVLSVQDARLGRYNG